MATTTTPAPVHASNADAVPFTRILDEGYGPGAWHGADLKAALADVPESLAFRRPGDGRHSIAEIALHHAFYVNSVAGRLTGTDPKPFLLEGSDWFELPSDRLTWPQITAYLAETQHELSRLAGELQAGERQSPLTRTEQLDLVLGITCHAVYHAGQIQLIKVLLQPR